MMCHLDCENASRHRGDNVDDWIEGPCGENPGKLKAEVRRLRARLRFIADSGLRIASGCHNVECLQSLHDTLDAAIDKKHAAQLQQKGQADA